MTSMELRVLTLNCWGLKHLSKHRRERMEALAVWLLENVHDLVLLQEVWVEEDFFLLQQTLKPVLPHAHRFDSGVIGSGLCIFSSSKILEASFIAFSMNGYPHKLWHGDWFSGKGIGLCKVRLMSAFDVNIFVTHYHAEYDRNNDLYLGHRVLHSLESAQLVKLASLSADLTICGGDFNSHPTDAPIQLIKAITPLQDCWELMHAEDKLMGGYSSLVPSNSFTPRGSARVLPNGKRIDYILFRSGSKARVTCLKAEMPLPERVPNKSFSFSDHEAVSVLLRLERQEEVQRHEEPNLSYDTAQRKKIVQQCIDILQRSLATVRRDKVFFQVVAVLLIFLFIATFLPTVLIQTDWHLLLDVGLFVPRFAITICIFTALLMATLFNARERKALKSASKILQLVLVQDEGLLP